WSPLDATVDAVHRMAKCPTIRARHACDTNLLHHTKGKTPYCSLSERAGRSYAGTLDGSGADFCCFCFRRLGRHSSLACQARIYEVSSSCPEVNSVLST